MLKAVVFDWSGTLYDDYQETYHGLKRYYLKPEFVYRLYFSPFMEAIRYRLALLGVRSPLLFKPRRNAAPSKLFPYTKELLQFFKNKKMLVVVISFQSKPEIETIAKKEGIRNNIDYILGGAIHKGIEIKKLLRIYRVKEYEALFVSDLGKDIEEVKKTKVFTCAVTWGYDNKDRLRKARPDSIVTTFYQLKTIIHKLNLPLHTYGKAQAKTAGN